ncbi:MAG: hypothetical protein QW828_06285, partial [Candidatus Bathyarchaeia archaeon]
LKSIASVGGDNLLRWDSFIGAAAVVLLIVALALRLADIQSISGLPVMDAGQMAFGYLAAGNFATGVFAAGIFSAGIFAAGILSIGIFAVGVFSIGLFSVGTFALGVYCLYAGAIREEKK